MYLIVGSYVQHQNSTYFPLQILYSQLGTRKEDRPVVRIFSNTTKLNTEKNPKLTTGN